MQLMILFILFALFQGSHGYLVETQYGPVVGFVDSNGVGQFLGIPYATPPVGDLRWKPPIKPTSFSTPWNATAFGNKCPQYNIPVTAGISEDCLYLNVYVPPLKGPLPVRVFMHGGIYLTGSSNDYPCSELASLSETIVVTLNYRLNIFGFVSFSALLQEQPKLSFGLQDQQFALIWIQNNIAAFGGDPQQVMLTGESAGGSSTILHMTIPTSWPYFQKALIESNGPRNIPTASQLASLTDPLLVSTPCFIDGKVDLKCLRALPTNTVMNNIPPTMLFYPVVDGKFIFQTPGASIRSGNFYQIPVLIGFNKDEGNLYAALLSNFNSNITADFYEHIVSTKLFIPENVLPDVFSLYQPVVTELGYNAALGALVEDFFIKCSTKFVAEACFQNGQPTWVYEFTYFPHTFWIITSLYGVTHSVELPFVFHTSMFGFNLIDKVDLSVSSSVVELWSNFHKFGNPNGNASVEVWPPYVTDNGVAVNTLIIDVPESGVSIPVNEDRCPFWEKVLSQPVPMS